MFLWSDTFIWNIWLIIPGCSYRLFDNRSTIGILYTGYSVIHKIWISTPHFRYLQSDILRITFNQALYEPTVVRCLGYTSYTLALLNMLFGIDRLWQDFIYMATCLWCQKSEKWRSSQRKHIIAKYAKLSLQLRYIA